MKNNYTTPQFEIIEIELEEAVLGISGLTPGNSYGEWLYGNDDDDK